MHIKQWKFGAPSGHHCCSFECDNFDEKEGLNPQATWTLLNPSDGGEPLYYCDDCHSKMVKYGR